MKHVVEQKLQSILSTAVVVKNHALLQILFVSVEIPKTQSYDTLKVSNLAHEEALTSKLV